MTGTWTGTYKYKTKNPTLSKRETLFTLTITENDGENFKGIVFDDSETGGTKGQGTIIGTIKNGNIEFVKQMPILTLITKKGRKIEAPKEHNPIYYKGILNSDQTFEGEWKIKGGITINKYVFAFGFGTTGTWKMSKM